LRGTFEDGQAAAPSDRRCNLRGSRGRRSHLYRPQTLDGLVSVRREEIGCFAADHKLLPGVYSGIVARAAVRHRDQRKVSVGVQLKPQARSRSSLSRALPLAPYAAVSAQLQNLQPMGSLIIASNTSSMTALCCCSYACRLSLQLGAPRSPAAPAAFACSAVRRRWASSGRSSPA
jgi:hypothetical protein